jgi:hypothetical protein
LRGYELEVEVFDDFISTVIPIIVGILILALIGALVSLPVLIPPIRKLGQRSTTARVVEIIIIGLVSLVISFGLLTWLNAQVTYIFSTVGTPPWSQVENPLAPAIVKELWIRRLMPPPLQQPCYTTDMAVCQRADWAPGDTAYANWGAYLMSIGICLVSSLTGGTLAWFLTRQKQHNAE